jgi:hypothetical protein
MKHAITHLLVLIVGLALGIGWGVHHPTQAAQLANGEDAAYAKVKYEVAKAKIALLEKFLHDKGQDQPAPANAGPATQPTDAEYKTMLAQEKQNLTDAQQTPTK